MYKVYSLFFRTLCKTQDQNQAKGQCDQRACKGIGPTTAANADIIDCVFGILWTDLDRDRDSLPNNKWTFLQWNETTVHALILDNSVLVSVKSNYKTHNALIFSFSD